MVRYKKRYLLAEIIFEDGLVESSMSSPNLLLEIRDAVQTAHGDYGLACVRSSLKVKYLNTYTSVVFIGCSRDYYRMVWSALTFVKTINKRRCIVRVLHVGGTLRTCQKFLIKYNKDQLLQLLQQCKTQAEKASVSEAIRQATDETSVLTPFKASKRRKTQQEKKESEQDTTAEVMEDSD